jgi:hypothetical protein
MCDLSVRAVTQAAMRRNLTDVSPALVITVVAAGLGLVFALSALWRGSRSDDAKDQTRIWWGGS